MRKFSGRKIVFVGMSGGVDSSVAAALLIKKGREVIGVYIKGYNIDGCGERDVEDARRAAEVLRIPFYVFDFEKEYKEKVVAYMIDGYRRGITPNPDVMCNKEIKFGLFLKKALEMGADYVATGHYVRLASRYIYNGTGVVPLLRRNAPTPRSDFSPSAKPSKSELRSYRAKYTDKLAPNFYLLGAKDKNKDQSYFLWTLTQGQLKHCLFPIGDYLKPEVRATARKFRLPNAEKKDSQGVCFLGRVSLKDFLSDYIPGKQGIILNTSGQVIGEHCGVHFYTIGQRRGLCFNGKNQISGIKRASEITPYYIAEKDAKSNAILVAEEGDKILYKKEIKLTDVNFINEDNLFLIQANNGIKVFARVRYRQPLASATLIAGRQSSVVSCKLVFDKPQKFVAPGQSAVFYLPAVAPQGGAKEDLPARIRPASGEKEGSKLEMLGGGIIV